MFPLLLIIVIICIVILIVMAASILRPVTMKLNQVKLSDLPTGSLVFTTHIKTRHLRNMSGISSNHAAMIVNTGEKVYVVEHATRRGRAARECNAQLIPVEEALRSNNIYVLARKYTGPPITFLQIKQAMEKLVDKRIYMSFVADFMYHNYTPVDEERDGANKNIVCSEYIYMMKILLGMVKFDQKVFTNSYRHLESDDKIHYEKLADLVV